VLSATSFRPLRFDCSINEQARTCADAAKFEVFVLHNFFTGENGE
jgi:hypothetical protein